MSLPSHSVGLEQKPPGLRFWVNALLDECPLRCVEGEGSRLGCQALTTTLSAHATASQMRTHSARQNRASPLASRGSGPLQWCFLVGKNEKEFSQQIPKCVNYKQRMTALPELETSDVARVGPRVSPLREQRPSPSPPPSASSGHSKGCRAGETGFLQRLVEAGWVCTVLPWIPQQQVNKQNNKEIWLCCF